MPDAATGGYLEVDLHQPLPDLETQQPEAEEEEEQEAAVLLDAEEVADETALVNTLAELDSHLNQAINQFFYEIRYLPTYMLF